MEISSKTIVLIATALVAGIALHQYAIRHREMRANAQPPSSPVQFFRDADTPANTPATAPSALDQTTRAAALAFPSPAPVPTTIVDPFGSPAIQQRMVAEQVRRMQKYAQEAGADDPFAQTPEQIEAFRKRGNPIVW